jgi:predicted  nucleic acid-binding Zn-ribbon protein
MTEELKGRIEILEQQRNDAMNQCVLLGGQIKQMIEQIEVLSKKLKDSEDGNDESADESEDQTG